MRVSAFATELVEVGDEGLGLRKSLGVLNALDVAVVCMFVRGLDCDDTIRAWHLELEVGIVGHCHELGVARSPQDGVVGSPETDYFEGEDFLAVVGRGAEADGKVDAPEGLRAPPRHDAMEGCNVAS